MADDWDVVVAGAGHNALVCAAYLARAGLKVLVLERAGQIGGDTSTEELTLPGFLHDACANAHVLIQSSPMLRNNELGLDRFGLRYLQPDPVAVMPRPGRTGSHVRGRRSGQVAVLERRGRGARALQRRARASLCAVAFDDDDGLDRPARQRSTAVVDHGRQADVLVDDAGGRLDRAAARWRRSSTSAVARCVPAARCGGS